LLALLSAHDPAPILPRVALVLGGEVLPPSLLSQLHALAAPCRIFNHYGPTEATIGALIHDLGTLPSAAESYSPPASVPLGRPLANGEAHLLDAWGHPVPAGIAGELWLGGPGLAQGYLHQPDLTRQRFVSHPFQPGSSARLYRTGDLARLDEQGRICFLGRVDGQVKLRGFRIELGEIEAALCQHPGVRTAAVVLEQQEGREPRLVAYLVARSAQPPSREQVRAFLAHRLPEVMIPAVCVPLDALPLTPNGKLDRRRLPAPDTHPAQKHETSDSGQPRSPLEEIL